MALETGTYIDDLNSANPVGASDPKSEGDDHIRLLKATILATFPNITGAVNPTQTDLNLLTGQEGIFLNDFFVDSTGTADAMIADFTPNVSLTDGVTVMVKAFGAITILAPTFTPDGLTTKTIVKGNGNELDLSDIPGANATLLLQYDGTLDAWILLNPLGAGKVYDAMTETTSFILSSSVAEDTFESIGPTGSGATNIWTALDDLPTGKLSANILIQNAIGGASTGVSYLGDVHARKTGSAAALGISNRISRAQFTNRSAASEADSTTTIIKVPLDSTLSFDMTWAATGTTPTQTVALYLAGWD